MELPKSDVGHDHGHGHDENEYYIEQLLTILLCGATGTVAVLMYVYDRLTVMLAPQFHGWVLGGGIVLLLMAFIRGVVLWNTVKPLEAGHVHGPDCDHGHDHGDHDHMPGAVYLKIIPLALPVLLFVMGLPNAAGFSQEWVNRRLGEAANIGEIKSVEAKEGDVITLDFAELNMAAYDGAKRANYEGRRVRVKGQLKSISEKDYTLFKLKMTCCAADMIPLKARIKSDVVIPRATFKDNDWVSVEGVLQFVEVIDKQANSTFIPVFRIGEKLDGLQPAAPE